MKIDEIAKETGLSISHIRFYERKGLLSPVRSEENNCREYSRGRCSEDKEDPVIPENGDICGNDLSASEWTGGTERSSGEAENRAEGAAGTVTGIYRTV